VFGRLAQKEKDTVGMIINPFISFFGLMDGRKDFPNPSCCPEAFEVL